MIFIFPWRLPFLIVFPVIARVLSDEMYEHFIVIYNIDGKSILIGDPAESKVRNIEIYNLARVWLGQIITFEREKDFVYQNERENNLFRFNKDIKKQYKFMGLVLIESMVILFINISGAYLFKFILSDSYNTFYIFGHIVTNGIDKICLTLFLMYIFRAIVEIIRCNMLTTISKDMDISITMKYYSHLIKIKSEAFDTHQAGDFISRFYDTEKIRNALSSIVLSSVLDTLMAVICGVILSKLNIKLFVIAVITMGAYFIIVTAFKEKLKKVNNGIMAYGARVTSNLKESIDGIHTIKSYGLEEKNIARIKGLYEKYTDKILHGARVANIQGVLTAFTGSVGILIVLSVGYKDYLKGIINISDLFMFYYVLDYFMGPIMGLLNLQPDIEAAIIAADRISDVLDISEENDNNNTEKLNGDIIFDDVTFRYGYDEPVFEHFTCKVPKGSKVAVSGKSGSGKTTMAKLLMRFYTPESGSIMIGSKNIERCSVESIRSSIAYIAQDTFLFEDTIYNNLTMGNTTVDEKDVDFFVKKCGLDDYINRLPLGYNTIISESGKNLSGGQKQRISIIRALLSGKNIMIFDEATNNLEEELEHVINELIVNLPNEVTCLIITHREKIIEKCNMSLYL